jgi:uncharacterized protein
VTSLRGIESTTGAAPGFQIRIWTRPSPDDPFVQSTTAYRVTNIDASRNEIIVGGGITPASIGLAAMTDSYSTENVYITLEATAPTKPASTPVFQARDKGSEGNDIAVQIRASDRPPITILGDNAAHTRLDVSSVASVYIGAIVEIHVAGADNDKEQRVVTDINPATKQITIDAALAGTPPANSTLRVLEIDILVYGPKGLAETFTGLSWNPNPLLASFSRYYRERINDPLAGSKLVEVLAAPAEPAAPTLATQPVTISGQPVRLQNGTNGSPLDHLDLIGTDGGPGNRTGIEALRERDDIALVAVPGVTLESVQAALLVHCENLKYRFAVLDGIHDSDISKIQAHRNNYDSKYGGYYTPWLLTMDLSTGREMLCPPSGYVLGICARVDNERGVHKAPANEVVRGITGIGLPFGDGEQDVLNPQGINLIREFEGRGIRVWGGRTTTSDSEWKYVNVRRLFIFLEHSIDRGTQWVVFEPNNEALWKRVVDTIESFLFGVWKTGALMGTTPEEGFFVRCDRTTMTQDDIDNGRLVCEIGVAPTYPAEFVIFRIGQFTASSNA